MTCERPVMATCVAEGVKVIPPPTVLLFPPVAKSASVDLINDQVLSFPVGSDVSCTLIAVTVWVEVEVSENPNTACPVVPAGRGESATLLAPALDDPLATSRPTQE